MGWSLFAILVVLFAYLGDEHVTKDRNASFFARVFLVLILSYVATMCIEGADKQTYLLKYNFEEISFDWNSILESLSFESDEPEIGFVMLRNLCYWLGFSGIGFLLVVSIITNSIIVKTFYRFQYPVLVFFLYIMSINFLQQANLVRQLFSVSIGLLSIKPLINKDWKKFLLLVFLAFTIHRSSAILLIASPLLFVKEERFGVFNIILSGLWILSLLMVVITIPVLEQFSILFEDTRYATYGNADVSLGLNDAKFDIVYNLLVIFCFIFYKDSKNFVYVFWFVMGCILKNAAFNAIFLQRVAYFFTPMFCAFTPTLLASNALVDKRRYSGMTQIMQGLLFLFYFRILISAYIIADAVPIGENVMSLTQLFR